MNKRFQNQMNTTKIIKLLFSTLFLLSTMSNAQNLTISNTGQTTSPGTNWSLSGSTLTVTGTANIRASVIVNALANGNLTVVGNTTNFAVTVSEAITATGNNTLTVGSATNTGTITFNAVTSFAGPVTLYGGSINMDQNMTCTSSGSPILLQSTGAIDIAASRTVQSNSGNITLRSNSGGTVLSNASSIILNSSSSLLSQGGNITLGGNFTGAQGAGLYATSGNAPAILISGGTISAAGGNIKLYGKCNGSYDDGIRLTGTINTTGTGTIELYGEAYGGLTGSTYFGGVTFGTANTTVSTENGNLTIEGILTNTNSSSASGLNFYRVAGGNGSLSIQLLSKTGNIQVSGRKAPSAASSGIGQCSQGDVYIGSPKDNSWTATGNIIMSLSSFDLALSTGIIFKTMGALNVEPYDASFNSSLTFPFTNNSSISGVSAFTMGKASNTANITIGAPGISVAGPITLYGGALSLGANITSTAGGEIALYSDAALAGLSSARSITTTGAFRYLPQGTSFSSTVTFPITNLSLVNITELQLGKSGNTADITIGTSVTIAGPISIYGGYVDINGNITSTATGDLFFQGIAEFWSIRLATGKTIEKTAGTGLLTMQGNGRINNSTSVGSILASGTARLDVVIINEMDDGTAGLYNVSTGNITTNGGHLWISAGAKTRIWNGLSVGSTGVPGNTEFNGIDVTGNISTNGGDILLWATVGSFSRGAGYGDIAALSSNRTISSGSGDITLMTRYNDFVNSTPDINISTTGTLTLTPASGASFDVGLSITGTTASGTFTGSGFMGGLIIQNFTSLNELVIGTYNGTGVSGDTPYSPANAADIAVDVAISVAGKITIYGGDITFSQNLSTTNTTTGNILLNGTTISGAGNIAIAAGRTATLNVSSNSTYDGIVSGSGSGLTKSGIGMLTLTKDHTYSGATTVTAGDLQVGTGGSVSQASSGSISNTSAVAVASGSKLILTPNENILFAAPISGAGGVEIKGASGRYLNTWLTGTPTLFATNTTVLEALTRITGGLMDGGAVTGTPACGAYQKSFSAATNTATLQLQVYNGASPNYYTKCVFVKLSQSGSNVMIQANTSIYGSGAGYKSGNVLGTNIATGGISMALATSAASSGYGIAEVYMSGKVNFTGNLTYSGNTVLSNTVTSVSNSTNISSYTSKGTQEITDTSTGFPSASSVINNGLVIFNRATPLTIASNMEGTEEVLQVGAAITLTGANTHTGITTIDLNKSLLIGNGSTSGSITGNIINYGSLTFNRSDNSTYPGIISGSGSLTKLGEGSHTLTGLNTYAGATTINDGRLILERDVPATSSSGYSGIGTLVIQPSSNSFTSAVSYPIAGFTVSSSIGGLTLGKPTNSANITFTNATQAAGPITAYGGTITLNANLTTTNNGDISLYTDNALGGLTTTARTITAAGSFNYIPRSDFFSAPVTYPITNLNLTSSGLLIGKSTNTAAITFANATTVAGPITAYGGTITLDANLTTTNNGAISLYTDNALGGLSTARTLTAAGAFKYIPRTTTFSADVTYPITNLTATSTGLTIGKTTNDKNITISQDVTGGAGIELYGNNVNINANLKTTSGGAMYLKGITTIAAGKYIESNGNFTHDGNMTFKSTATATAAFGKLGGTFTTVSGKATIERYIPAKRAYRFLSPSVTTTTSIKENWQENGGSTAGLGTHITGTGGASNGFDATATNNPSLYSFNNSTGAWAAVTSTLTNLTAGTPYRLMVRGDRTVSLTINNPTATPTVLRATGTLKTGNYTPTLNQTANGYSFVGNPYQAPIDIKAVLTASTNMNTDVVYYWDPTLNSRGTYVTRTLGIVNQNSVTSSFNQYLQPGQAVFVKKDNTAIVPIMTITENDKSIVSAAAGVFRNASSNEIGVLRANLKASVNNEWTTIEGALALFHSNYSWGATQEDATKLSNLDEEVSFVQNNTSLAIAMQSNPALTDELPIKLNTTRYTNYQWHFELTNYDGLTPYLFDAQNNTFTQIENNTIVPFTVNGQEQTRFKIVFQNGTLNTPDFSNQMVLYPNPGKADSSFYLTGINNAKVSLYNLLGQNLPVETTVDGATTKVKPSVGLSQGVYVVFITQEGKTAQVKWIVE